MREVDVTQADFVGLRLARPAEAFIGHAAILLGRYHSAPYSVVRERIIASVAIGRSALVNKYNVRLELATVRRPTLKVHSERFVTIPLFAAS